MFRLISIGRGRVLRRFGFGVVLVFCVAVSARAAAPQKPLVFEKHVQPLLKARCFHCHGEEAELQGGLDLRLKRLIQKGGDSGPAIDPKNASESYLITRLRAGEMPPQDAGKPLSKEEIDLIARWIDEGANTLGPEPDEIGQGLLITPEDRNYWAFQPIHRPALPLVKDQNAVFNPIDAFILSKLEAQGLTFSPEADKRTLIRRLTLDLWGLPPTPEEVEAFLHDKSPKAYERLVDRLLASPRYGERWARHWLDVAGYADSEGVTNEDTERKWAWKYRDYVIRSFNADKPVNEFIIEQLAGDELIEPPYANLSPEDIEKLTATGFLRMAPDGTAGRDIDKPAAQNQVIADTIEIVTGSFLGLSVKCAQCHEHRYDPISQADYYRLRAIFEPAWNAKPWRTPPGRLISLTTDADRKRSAELEAEAKAIDQERTKRQSELIEAVFERELKKVPAAEQEAVALARNTPAKKRNKDQVALLRKYPSVNVSAGSLYLYDRKAADELSKLAAKAKAIRDQKPQPEFVRALTEVPGQVPPTFLFARGDHEQPKEELSPAGLTILAPFAEDYPLPVDDSTLKTTGRRLAYANWLTSGEHPLVARVWVNRIWRNHLGRGIVETPSDFGRLGEPPSHPELLDWLASEFMQTGWRQKHLHRLILNSRTYRQSLRTDEKHQALDPDNTLFGGARLRRMEAEVVRDSMLSVAGNLNSKPFGPPVPVMADLVGQWVIGIENLNAGRPGAVIPMNGEDLRRSLYVQVRRSRPLAVLETFDGPRMEPVCEARTSSTVAPQSLMLMNGTFTLAQAREFAKRLLREAGPNGNDQITLAWKLAYSREPEPTEREEAAAFLAAQAEDLSKRSPKDANLAQQALAILCQVLLGSNEFLYVD